MKSFACERTFLQKSPVKVMAVVALGRMSQCCFAVVFPHGRAEVAVKMC